MTAAIFIDTEDGTDIHIVNSSGKRTTHCGIPTDGNNVEKQISRYMKRTEFVKHLESFTDATVCTDCRETFFEL